MPELTGYKTSMVRYGELTCSSLTGEVLVCIVYWENGEGFTISLAAPSGEERILSLKYDEFEAIKVLLSLMQYTSDPSSVAPVLDSKPAVDKYHAIHTGSITVA